VREADGDTDYLQSFIDMARKAESYSS